jgi:hypothetical protein
MERRKDRIKDQLCMDEEGLQPSEAAAALMQAGVPEICFAGHA